eukprot:CAMPEP_0114342158 /NCGR_PEP_ID=MMETSP0101-20121206/9587_1 /TAXON_ID=38822 ORGANISM="Pteridomonas danica, Strain PT" /NCGR_SAMPLE_ID=MMETSP0101 /ASSEMBLY_ACC=CAM_ASM_000211 /LENGTH=204 /DNA_ID=CAMNT_0001476121 /DNA_START=22 /DNA_END=636 /DNA_ORIENTATION=+
MSALAKKDSAADLAAQAIAETKLRMVGGATSLSARVKALEDHVAECENTLALKVTDLRELHDAIDNKTNEIAKYEAQANKKSDDYQQNIDSTVEILDGLKSDVADNNTDLNTKRAYDAEMTEKTDTDNQKIEVMKVTQSEKEAMVAQLEAAGVENTEQIAELEEASTQLAAELEEVLKTIEESRAKIDKYTSERAGQKSAVPKK